MQNLGFQNFIQHADAVALFILAVLLIMSIGTWYYILTKGWRTWQSRARSREFLSEFWAAPSLEAVARKLRSTGVTEPFSHLVHHGFTAVEQHQSRQVNTLVEAGTAEDFLTRSLKRAIDQDKARLEGGLTFLATVASSAPFVGLFGTVWGIYHALVAIGASGQGGLDQVAGPVGEALIMTGLGLAVAIPSAVAYNVFVRLNRNTLVSLNSFAHDVFAFLATGLSTGPLLSDVERTSDRVIYRFQQSSGQTREVK
ncbi:MotA/TolQ/ExbB proton channel family protein [Amnimonas aquatica]|uniref:Biopolymer transport protein ExbB n=1 Tax=Amnimonas aquatica TaxID=2094561 RepID=A0A2P6AQX7_9GAMM|nr:MotA/TolQ/ExbB proton channel family protein [Amnimonas aquatica]PQA32664.1 biopolymer transporter ExbB [Amnimonas aquatica]